MEGQTYEKLIRQRATGRECIPRLVLLLSYVAWLCLCVLILTRLKFSAALVVLLLALTVVLILVTWKYVQIEYEYSIYGGSFFLAKIYGKKKRKELLEIDLKHAKLIAPRTEEYLEKANAMNPQEIVWAVSSPKSEDLWMIVYPINEKQNSLLFFEADERAIALLRKENPRATARVKEQGASYEA